MIATMNLDGIEGASNGLPRFRIHGTAPHHFSAPLGMANRPSARTPWLITIVDLVTLLLAFFVLMFSMSRPEGERLAAVAKSYTEAFGPARPAAAPDSARLPTISAVAGEDLAYLEAVLKAAFAGSATLKEVEFQRTAQYLILSLPVDGMFAPGLGSFTDNAAAPVFDLGGVLSNLKNRIAVVGTAVMSPPAREAAPFLNAGLPPAREAAPFLNAGLPPAREAAPFLNAGFLPAHEATGVAAWSLAMARAQSMAGALKSAGYDQPVTVLGRGGDATDVGAAIGRLDILIMPELIPQERPAS